MNQYADQFEAALKLFDYSGSRVRNAASTQLFQDWLWIAARDVAMSVYHFSCALDYATADLKDFPSLRAQVDSRSIKTARDVFESLFPDVEALRHAMAHEGHQSTNAKERARHAFGGDFAIDGLMDAKNVSELTFYRARGGRVFKMTHGGQIVSLEISGTTLRHLRGISDRIHSAFQIR